MSTSRELFTVGHSTHEIDDFIALLRGRSIAAIADVRRFPGSRRNPQFGQERLAESLADEGIAYEWFEDLGGRRNVVPGSPNGAWEVAAFQGYADHMATPEFHEALSDLLAGAATTPTTVMCSEAVPWRCHRSLIADAALARGARVLHIMDAGVRPHVLTRFARVADGEVRYDAAEQQPGPASLFDAGIS